MGEIVNIRCDSCHTGWECRTGSGLMHGSLDSVAGIFSPEQQTEIALSAKQDPLSLFTFSFRPARCSRCHGIVSIPVLTLTESDSTFIAFMPRLRTKNKAHRKALQERMSGVQQYFFEIRHDRALGLIQNSMILFPAS